ncbi:glycine-rich RNA-binding protein 2, mitochondrial-like isoform X1 [Humulus lupulus]|uniref:glycine-rich RNA-binding protein 2, mitochondrial-like isoform X1 n=1 Tax=Humulus lupulus TaxID=3486 RepID=UPI002B4038E7|nr:glycine-rich RNA-binding protein 2, mitochondrial-like isoform X1 [Humulus lupulus]
MRGVYGGSRIWHTFTLTRNFCSRHFSSKLFIGGLSFDTNEPVLKAAFEQHGDILEVKVICDHKSGRSKGYGFVHFTSETAATTALQEMDGQEEQRFGRVADCISLFNF